MKQSLLLCLLATSYGNGLNVVDAIMGRSQDDATQQNSAVEDVKNAKAISLTGRHTCLDSIKRL